VGVAASQLLPLPAAAVLAPPTAWVKAEQQVGVELSINDDATPDLVAFCEPADGVRTLYGPADLCGIDGATWKPLWRIPVRDKTPRDVLLAVTGRTVVLVDPSSTVSFLDGRNGKLLGTLRLGQRARHLCAEAGPYLWAETEDRAHTRIDVLPRKLGPNLPPGTRSVLDTSVPCRYRRYWFQFNVGDFAVRSSSVDGNDGVALVSEGHGSSVPYLAGFAPPGGGQRPARWTRPVAPDRGLGGVGLGREELLDLAGGQAFTTYTDLRRVDHVIAVAAGSGKQLWDRKMPDSVSMLQASKTRVYVGGDRRLDVLDAATGKVLGTFGVPAAVPR
jgi:hypothetical protein